ncbi:helix-turn-helix transcriptional regulator [Photobacterium carnosum]|uniref:helix-turn-helix transcriptional regulator n=1 Tax=Photobacterium carnosum TaxID=2023717 RepID=UPI001E602E29|nr:hypothetical protein [Photobacterium carnosum]
MEKLNLNKFFNNYIKEIGLDLYSIVIVNDLEPTRIYTNMKNSWKEDFIKSNMDIESDIVKHAKKKIAPFLWSLEDIENEKLLEVSKKHNITVGATFIININCNIVLFSIYPDKNKDEFKKIFNNVKSTIQLDCLIFFEDFIATTKNITLSNREKDVIDLLKFGNKYDNISRLLNIKERTVRYHVNNIMIKLNVTSVKHAIFKATRIGLI